MGEHLDAMQTAWYGFVERFNHSWPLNTFSAGCRTLEIGAGIGSHLKYENHTEQKYHAIELLPALCDRIKTEYPEVVVKCADCQKHLPYGNRYFDRIIAIHVLEHLPNLPAALFEMRRVLKKNGRISLVIPCEGSLATTVARNISTRPHFEKKYKQSYDWFIKSQHINVPDEVISEIGASGLKIVQRRYYPFSFIPLQFCNLFIGMTLSK